MVMSITSIDEWLDGNVGSTYNVAPLAQDWARVSKIAEELGEAISELILYTGQNPRKPIDPDAYERMLKELADVVCTGTLAIQHFTKNEEATRSIIDANWAKIEGYVSTRPSPVVAGGGKRWLTM